MPVVQVLPPDVSRGARRPLLAALAAALSLALIPAPATARPEWNQGFREKVDLAGAVWITETENTFTDVTLRVFDLTEQSLPGRPRSYDDPGFVLFVWHVERDEETGTVTETNYEGFVADPSTFEFDRSLQTGASVTGTMQLYGWQCVYPAGDGGPVEGWVPAEPTMLDDDEVHCTELGYTDVELDLDWTAQGGIYRDVQRVAEGDPSHFRFHARTVQAVSDAAVTGTIGGDELDLVDGPATFGILLRGAYLERHLVQG